MDVGPDFFHRFWADMIARTEGPMTFRLYLQPAMALITALIDGIKDARTGRTPYFWLLTHTDAAGRKAAWREGVTATTRILLLGVAMDVIYQLKVYGAFSHPLETLVVAIVLAFVPYLLMRGPIARIARWWISRR